MYIRASLPLLRVHVCPLSPTVCEEKATACSILYVSSVTYSVPDGDLCKGKRQEYD